MSKSKNMASIEDVKQMYIPFEEISLATNEFAQKNLIARGGFGRVYRGESEKHGRIAVKRLDREHGQGEHQFEMEISLLSKYKHENIVSLIGFCDDDVERILVYKFESNGSLDKHLKKEDLTWIRRIQICLDAAQGLTYLHDYNAAASQPGIFHRDVKSANILLDEKWKAKISDFGLSRVGSHTSFVISNPCGTGGYIDPNYENNGILSQKSDVYSFGVVLGEVMFGMLAYDTSFNKKLLSLTTLVDEHSPKGTLYKMIPLYLRNQMNPDSFDAFTKTAYQCLRDAEKKRPTMEQVVRQLKVALQNQQAAEKPEEEKKAEKEEKPTPTGDENKGKKFEDTQPHEIVLSVFMHCGECARRVRQCLYNCVEGVEKVSTYCETSKVIVKGKKADPLKVLERVKKETGRTVELLSSIPKPPVNKPKKTLQENKEDEASEKPEEENKAEKEEKTTVTVDENKGKKLKDTPPPPPPPPPHEIVLSVFMHCEECARRVRRCLYKGVEGVEKVFTYCETSKVVVKGEKANPLKVLEKVKKETGRRVELLSPVSKLPVNKPKKTAKK